MKVEILGPGCAKCNTLYENAKAAVQELGIDCEIVKVSDIAEMAGRGVLITPALVIDGEVKISGKALSTKEIVALLGSQGGG